MRHSFSGLLRAFASTLARAAGLVLLVGCGDARIKELSPGISRDSTLRIIGSGATVEDSLPNVYRAERYLSKAQMLEVLFYSPSGEKEGRDSMPEGRLTPIVLRDGVVTGWGWQHFDSVAAEHGIPRKPRGD